MISKTLFESNVFVEIQGNHVLDLLEKSKHQANYRVIGFDMPGLLIKDKRKDVNKILDECLSKDDLSSFGYSFSRPAKAKIKINSKNDYLIEFDDAEVDIPEYMLWIVVGIEGAFPIYPYELQEVQFINENINSGMVVYKLEQEIMKSFVELSQNASFISDRPVENCTRNLPVPCNRQHS